VYKTFDRWTQAQLEHEAAGDDDDRLMYDIDRKHGLRANDRSSASNPNWAKAALGRYGELCIATHGRR
jgi:hypothetical protein